MIWLLAIVLVDVAVYWLCMSSYSQIWGRFPYRVKTSDKVIALTFDDGPNEPFTSQILDYLDQSGVKATFFQVGSNVAKNPALTKKIAAHGHQIGIHSWSHAFHKYFSEASFQQEIDKSQALFQEVLGKKLHYFRPPWLWRYPLLFKTLKKNGLQPVSGEFCHSLEVLQIPAERIAKATLKKAKQGAIIIFHDGYNAKGADRHQTVEAVKIVVPALKKLGYKFVTVAELLPLKKT